MKLVINGEEREFDGISTLSELLAQLGLMPDRVAVELNRELVSRESWAQSQLNHGDKLEIVHFVGGGLFSSTDVPIPETNVYPGATSQSRIRS